MNAPTHALTNWVTGPGTERVKLRVKECVSFKTKYLSLPLPSFKRLVAVEAKL